VHELGHGAESLDMQPQSDSRKCHVERLHRVDQPCSRHHHVDDESDLGFEPLEQAFDLGA